jgi:hypothetical protein
LIWGAENSLVRSFGRLKVERLIFATRPLSPGNCNQQPSEQLWDEYGIVPSQFLGGGVPQVTESGRRQRKMILALATTQADVWCN